MELAELVVLCILVLIMAFLVFLGYSGLFDSINVFVGRPYIGKVVLAYKYRAGPYSYGNYASLFAQSSKIGPNCLQMGIYYDDPNKVPQEQLRGVVGGVISNADGSVDETLWRAYEKEGFKKITLPSVPESVNVKFRHTTAISVIIAIFRVGPKMSAFIEEKGLKAFPTLEIYDKSNILHMAPLSRNDEFFVPESLESSVKM